MILNEQQTMIRDVARAFAQEKLAPKAAEWDRTCYFPRAELREMGKLGFLGITVPEEWGGTGADAVSMAVILEELAAGDAGTSTIVSGHNSVACMPIVQFGTIEQKERFLRPLASGELTGAFALTEAHGGSEAGAGYRHSSSRPARQDTGWCVSNRKWASTRRTPVKLLSRK